MASARSRRPRAHRSRSAAVSTSPTADRGVQFVDQQGRHQVELLCPHRRRAGDRDDAARARSPASASRAIAAPATSGHDALHLGEQRRRRERRLQRRERVRQRARRAAAHAASVPVSDRAVGDATAASRRRSSAPGTCSRSVVVMTLWPSPRSKPTRPRAAIAVELAHHVVEQHHRGSPRASPRSPRARPAAARAGPAAAGPASRRRAARGPRDVSARSSRCGPCPVKPRSRSPGVALGRARPPARRHRRLSSAAGSATAGSPSSPSSSARAEKCSATASIAARAVGHQRDPVARQLAVPRGSEAVATPRRRGSARRARCAAPAPAHTRGGSATRAGHSAGDELVHVRPPQRGRALHQLQPVGQEDAHERPARRRRAAARRARRRPSSASARRARSRRSARAGRPAPRSSPRRATTCSPKRTSSRSFVVRAGAAGAAEVERVEQVRLAGAVAAGDDRHARAQLDVGGGVAAEVAQREAHDPHGGDRLDVQPDRHDEVEEAAVVRPPGSGRAAAG